jgi:hypothetical protein
MSDDHDYLMALSKRAQEILNMEKESKSIKESKPKTKKVMDEEQKKAVIERLAKAREKAVEVRKQKKQIKDAQLKEKHQEFEELKAKYLKPKEEPKETPKEPKETPKRERAVIPPYKEENVKETNKESLEVSKPIDIPKPKEEKEKPVEIIQNSIPTINKPKYFELNKGFFKKYGSLYS